MYQTTICPLLADSCRVILKGEYPDYINAAFVNVSTTIGTLREFIKAAHLP